MSSDRIGVGAVRKYIDGIRNEGKRAYAERYFSALLAGSTEHIERGTISLMAAQAVQLKIAEIQRQARIVDADSQIAEAMSEPEPFNDRQRASIEQIRTHRGIASMERRDTALPHIEVRTEDGALLRVWPSGIVRTATGGAVVEIPTFEPDSADDRAKIIADAESISEQAIADADAGPGKYENTDAKLAAAMSVLGNNGDADESCGSVADNGAAWRVGRFVAVEDSQGFVSVEGFDSIALAEKHAQSFDPEPEPDIGRCDHGAVSGLCTASDCGSRYIVRGTDWAQDEPDTVSRPEVFDTKTEKSISGPWSLNDWDRARTLADELNAIEIEPASEPETPKRDQSCSERIESHKDGRLANLGALNDLASAHDSARFDEISEDENVREMLSEMDCNPITDLDDREIEEIAEKARERMSEMPLAVSSYRVFRIDLSTGGPADWLEVVTEGDTPCYEPLSADGAEHYEITRVVYHFADWFDHAEIELSDTDLQTAEAFAREVVSELCG